MRLTLRTMLAYLDEILEPDDHQDIGRKIEESEFANGLVHRIRDVSRRMRLAAPKVSGRGMGLDPNTVAEYLDNTLAGERVPDFEKVCLESDVHLAEVAACHQILALVQVQPAEVDPDLRNQMYEMASRADEPAPAASARERNHAGPPALPAFAGASDGRSGDDEPARSVRPRPEVPDYLRSGSRSKFVPLAVTVLLAVCLLGAIVLASGPLDKTNALYKLVFGSEAAPDIAQPKNTGKPEPAASSTDSTGTNEKPGDHGRQPAVPADKTLPRTDIQAPGTVEQASAIHPSKSAGPDAVKGATDSGKNGLAQPSPEAPTTVGPSPADDKRAPVPPLPPEDTGKPAVPSAPVQPNDAPNESPTVAAFPADVPHPSSDVVGRLTSSADQEVLLRMAAGDGEWHRVGPAATFNTGEKLLVLPTFHPTVTLAAGITLQLVPETLIEFEGIDHGIPAVRVHYGRMVVMTTGKADVKLKLALGETSGILAFDDAEATVGVEVRPFHFPGIDPERNQPRLAIALYGINGDVSWNAASGLNAEKLHSPARLVLAADPTQLADRDVPKWLIAEPVVGMDKWASDALRQSLDEKRPVTQSLLELSGHRREENRSIAARSLALIDEFEPFDNLLNDDKERSVWPIQIESLKAAIARGPAVAAKVRAAFERQRGKDGSDLYRMLWGYSKEQLAGGAAAKLVELLDSDNMDLRVLSFYNLRQITGQPFYYRPEQSAANRFQSVRRFKDLLKEGLIGPKLPAAGKPLAASEPAVKTPAEPLPRLPAGEPAPSKVPPAPTPDSP
jgi:hypothetical protein